MDETTRKQFESLIKQVGDSVNGMGLDNDGALGVADGLVKLHRTLCQSAIGVLLSGMLTYANFAEKESRYDARNEAAVKLLCRIRDVLIENLDAVSRENRERGISVINVILPLV